jgi:hypothetical protein
MTEPSPARPVPGPPRPGDAAAPPDVTDGDQDAGRAGDPFADLAERPVGEHVVVFETEHARLQRELGTIDQL